MGKKNKLRACPALGREIGSAECGAGRHATIACPAGCPHDLFAAANYEALLEVETRLDRRTTQALADEIGPDRVRRIIDGATARAGGGAVNAAMIVALFVHRDAAGRSFAERWLAAGAPGLEKDERVFFAGKARMRVVLFEVIEVRADGLLRARDLLEPGAGEVLLLDRRGWARATRFQVLLVWAYPLPHYWRICGGAVAWPDWSGCGLGPAEALGELTAHAGGPATDAPLAERRLWLAEHFEELPARIGAVSDARRRAMWAAMDAVSVWCEYPLAEPESAALSARLDDAEADEVYRSDPAPGEEKAGFAAAYDVCLPPGPDDSPDRREVLGRVLARGSTWRIEATGRARLARLRARFFELLGAPEREPEREMVQDLGRQQAEKISVPDGAMVPPRLLADPKRVELKSYRLLRPRDWTGAESPEEVGRRTVEQAQAKWIDHPVPALDGLTPRAAATASPASRARLVGLLKKHLNAYDEACLRGKYLPDPQVIVQALGLTELDVPPPPARPCPPELAAEAARDEDDDHHDDEDEDDATDFAEGPGLEPLPNRPLSETEAVERLVRVQECFPTDDDLVDAWAVACPGWAQAVADWGLNNMEDNELDHLEAGLALAWAALGGADRPEAGRRLDARKLRVAFESAWARYDDLKKATDILAVMNGFNPGQFALQTLIQIRLGVDAEQRKEGKGSLAEVYMALAAWLDAAVPELERVMAEE